jgi:hypothetical protein
VPDEVVSIEEAAHLFELALQEDALVEILNDRLVLFRKLEIFGFGRPVGRGMATCVRRRRRGGVVPVLDDLAIFELEDIEKHRGPEHVSFGVSENVLSVLEGTYDDQRSRSRGKMADEPFDPGNAIVRVHIMIDEFGRVDVLRRDGGFLLSIPSNTLSALSSRPPSECVVTLIDVVNSAEPQRIDIVG